MVGWLVYMFMGGCPVSESRELNHCTAFSVNSLFGSNHIVDFLLSRPMIGVSCISHMPRGDMVAGLLLKRGDKHTSVLEASV